MYTTRELALPPELFLFLSRVNQFGAMLFAGAGTALLWYYPTQLFRFRFEWLMLPAVALILAANWGQWVPSLGLTARLPLMLWLVVHVWLAIMQWQRTRREPVERARLKWLIYAWFGGIVGYLGLVILPQLLGLSSLVHQTWGWIFLVLTYLGIALGIVRYRLFDLDRWILLAWFWFGFGVLFIVFDAFLVLALNIETSLGLLIALALAGWLYLPLRQSFLQRMLPKVEPTLPNDRLPDVLQQAFSQGGSIERQWQHALREVFQPLVLEPVDERLEYPALHDNGLRLRVPKVSEQGAWSLAYAQAGQRLFGRRDLAFVEQALKLFRFAGEYHQLYQRGVTSERQRVARDLHDDVGARLLSVVYRARQDPELRQLARDSLQELREVIQGLQKEQVTLAAAFQRWQAEAQHRCQLFGLSLDMTLQASDAQEWLNPRTERNLTRILRECLNNTLKHAGASLVSIQVSLAQDVLSLRYRDNGSGIKEALGHTDGIGILGMRQRCEELGGDLALWSPLAGGLALAVQVPLRLRHYRAELGVEGCQ